MGVQIRKWGNSAAVRIPASIMAAAAIGIGQEVEIREEEGRLVIEPVTKPSFSLDDLLSEMKPETYHEVIDFGPAVGNEML